MSTLPSTPSRLPLREDPSHQPLFTAAKSAAPDGCEPGAASSTQRYEPDRTPTCPLTSSDGFEGSTNEYQSGLSIEASGGMRL